VKRRRKASLPTEGRGTAKRVEGQLRASLPTEGCKLRKEEEEKKSPEEKCQAKRPLSRRNAKLRYR
jgi:hypothetical protein